ncbi:signal transduction histidine kinase [Linnemannia elongata]|nr:signal transduction histidine kinase [Linnemannia elongata]
MTATSPTQAPSTADTAINNIKGNEEPEVAEKGAETETETDAEEYDDNGIIDHTTFDQLLEMDDEEDHEFSRSLVWNYFEQAEKTFVDMNDAMEKLDFPDLSRLGHFLKGSSAALGLTKVKESCEKLQHYGNRKDAAGVESITNEEAETLIRALLVQMRREYNEAESYLKVFYDGQE